MKKILAIFTFLLIAVFLNGCINVNQNTVIFENGSGTINLHYWTKSYYTQSGEGSNAIQMGDDIGGFTFIESQIKEKYTSPNTEIKEMKKYSEVSDTTTHVSLLIAFKDFNKLNEAQGFAKIKTQWIKGEDGMDFSYVIPKDTTIKKEYIRNEDKLSYTFMFPNEVLKSNGMIEDKSVKWSKSVNELADGNIEMTATIKTKSKLCSMFGIELPVIILAGMIFINRKKIKTGKLLKR